MKTPELTRAARPLRFRLSAWVLGSTWAVVVSASLIWSWHCFLPKYSRTGLVLVHTLLLIAGLLLLRRLGRRMVSYLAQQEEREQSLKRAQAELLAREARLRRALSGAPLPMLLHAEDGEILLVNKAWTELSGYTHQDIPKVSDWMRLAYGPRADEVWPRVKRLYALAKAVSQGELEIRTRAGETRRWDFSAANLGALPDGRRSVLSMAVDVTDRRNAELALQQSEARYRLLAENVSDVIWVADVLSQQFLYVSPSVERLRGFKPEEVIAGGLAGWVTPKCYEFVQQELPKRLAIFYSGQDISYTDELEQPCKDGSVVITEVVSRLRINPVSGRLEVYGVTREITARKAVEAKLRRAQADMERAQAVGHIGSWSCAASLQELLSCSAESYRIIGIDETTFDGRMETLWARVHPDDVAKIREALQHSLSTKTPFRIEHRLVRPDGVVRWVRQEAEVECDSTGAPQRFVGIMQDITEARLAEQSLRESEAKYRAIFLNAGFAMCLQEVETQRFVEVNDAYAKLYGYTKAEMEAGLRLRDVSAQAEASTEAIAAVQELGCVVVPLRWHRKKDGTVFPVEVTAGSFWWQGRSLIAVLTHDIRARKEAEDALIESEERFRTAIESAPDAIFIETNRRFTYVNQKAVKVFGAASSGELLHQPVLERFHPDCQGAMENSFQQLSTANQPMPLTEQECVRLDGTFFDAEVTAVPFSFEHQRSALVFVRDTSQRKRLESQLRHAQKMEAIGRLAGGVAHDFNNILAAMLMQVNLVQLSSNLSAEEREMLDELQKGAQRAANLTRQLLMFSRQSVMRCQPLDVNEVIDNLLKMLYRLLGEDIQLRWRPGQQLPLIDADAGMLEQVITNLCVNARDAMPAGGSLTLSTDLEEFTRDSQGTTREERDERRPGAFVRLRVADEGCGMDESTRKRIFEPFFTTKEVGKGTGLGLATVEGIVKQHHGWVEVRSAPANGSTFDVFLPVSLKERKFPERMLKTVTGGAETILLVEDESRLRHSVATSLRRHGYEVLEAKSGPDALQVWREHHERIALVFTDMLMPEGMTGLELAQQVRAVQPHMPVIISSGYSLELVRPEIAAQVGVRLFPKPYDVFSLASAVRQAIDQVAGTAAGKW